MLSLSTQCLFLSIQSPISMDILILLGNLGNRRNWQCIKEYFKIRTACCIGLPSSPKAPQYQHKEMAAFTWVVLSTSSSFWLTPLYWDPFPSWRVSLVHTWTMQIPPLFRETPVVYLSGLFWLYKPTNSPFTEKICVLICFSTFSKA